MIHLYYPYTDSMPVNGESCDVPTAAEVDNDGPDQPESPPQTAQGFHIFI